MRKVLKYVIVWFQSNSQLWYVISINYRKLTYWHRRWARSPHLWFASNPRVAFYPASTSRLPRRDYINLWRQFTSCYAAKTYPLDTPRTDIDFPFARASWAAAYIKDLIIFFAANTPKKPVNCDRDPTILTKS